MNQLNPSISLVLAFIYSLLLSFGKFELFYLLPLFYLCYLQRQKLFLILKRALFLNFFVFVLFLFLLIEVSFQEAINVYIRASVIILFNLLLFNSSKGYDIVRALYILKFPNVLVSTMYFTLKMIENLTKDVKTIKNTLRARGFRAKTSMFTYNTFGNIMGMLLVNSIRKAQNLNNSFILRGFKGQIYLSDDFKSSKKDYILIILVTVCIILKVLL